VLEREDVVAQRGDELGQVDRVGIAAPGLVLPLGDTAQKRLAARHERLDATLQLADHPLPSNLQIAVGGDLAAEPHQLPGVLRRGGLEQPAFEPGAQRLGVLEPAVQGCELLAGRREFLVEALMAAGMPGFAGRGLRQQRPCLTGFRAGLVDARTHLLQAALEQEDAMDVAHDWTKDGI
jgi:hypothetical protein